MQKSQPEADPPLAEKYELCKMSDQNVKMLMPKLSFYRAIFENFSFNIVPHLYKYKD
jgi:hypothetical protein